MEPNRYKPYTRFGNGPKQYANIHVTAVIGTAVHEENALAIAPFVDDVVHGNNGADPVPLVSEVLDNLEAGQQLCGSKIDVGYIDDLIRRSTRIVLIAQFADKIAAFAILYDRKKEVEITILCSSERSTLKRAAAALIKIAAQYANALGKEEVFVESVSDRKSYYEQFGFVQSATEESGVIPMSADVDTLLVGGGAKRKTRRIRHRRAHRRKTRKY